MEYLDNIYTRLAAKCTAVSPSGGSGGYTGPFITVDSTVVTVDDTTHTVDEG